MHEIYIKILLNKSIERKKKLHYNLIMAKKKGMIKMVLPILSSKVTEGTTKDGRRYRWCSLWVPLEDGSIYEVRCDTEYPRGSNVEFALECKFDNLHLVPIGFAKEQ